MRGGRLRIAALGAVAVLAPMGAALAAGATPAGAGAVYVKGRALWLRDDAGAPRSLGALPGDLGAPAALLVDPAGHTLLVGGERGWRWAPLRGAADAPGPLALRKLPCAPGRAALTVDGSAVLCATSSGETMIVQLTTGRQVTRPLPRERVSIAGVGDELRLIWEDDRGIWTAPLAKPTATRQLAVERPLRDLSVSPTGERALGVYAGEAHHRKELRTQEMLYSFALDGRAARRKVIQRGVPGAWSADGRWALVQDGESACIMATTGGQYKCWRGYRGLALAADGHSALLLGGRDALSWAPRGAQGVPAPPDRGPGAPAPSAGQGADIDAIIESIEAGELLGEPPAPETPGEPSDAPGTGELRLYRAELNGAFAAKPTQLDTGVDGPAAFVPPLP